MSKTGFQHWWAGISPAAAPVIGGATTEAAAWQPNEMQVGPERELIDMEFSQKRAQFTWVDALGLL